MKNLKLTFLVTLFTVFSANSQTSFTKFVDKQISETPIAGLVTLDGGYLTIGKEMVGIHFTLMEQSQKLVKTVRNFGIEHIILMNISPQQLKELMAIYYW
jgi:hypothetical protein